MRWEKRLAMTCEAFQNGGILDEALQHNRYLIILLAGNILVVIRNPSHALTAS